ncbi:MAG TPA: primosomal protein, partial [Balneola sp.]|nr:primosomal protein [Balneola sp.]
WVWDNGALLEAEMVEMKNEFNTKQRNRNANKQALAFAKFLKRL